MIREADLADVPALVELGRHFVATSPYLALVGEHPAQIARVFEQLVTQDNGVLFVADGAEGPVGMIGVILFPHHFSGLLTAGELVWWVEPGARGTDGLRLLKRAEAWALAQGAQQMQMIQPSWETRLDRIYQRLGYDCVEHGWVKAIA